ncbi:11930_t:CDS:2, partial [Funneliformis mosseae]
KLTFAIDCCDSVAESSGHLGLSEILKIMRPQRDGEEHGKDYYYISKEEFETELEK